MAMEDEDKGAELLQIQSSPQATYSILTFSPGQLPKEYEGYIYAKWLRSARFGNVIYKRIPSDMFFKSYASYIQKLLARCQIRLAVLDEDKDVILGFACAEQKILHYVYVGRDQRRQGIGKALLGQNCDMRSHITKHGYEIKIFTMNFDIYTHFTKCGEEIIKKKQWKIMFNPFV